MILLLTQTFAPVKGGMEAYMTGLANELARAGRETVVFADGNDEGFEPQAPYVLKRFGGWRPLRRWKKRRATAAFLASGKVEGIFCDSWKSAEALPRVVSVPVVVLAHGSEFPPAASPRKAGRIRAALARARSVVANSRFTADAVRSFLSDPNDPRLRIVYPPLPPMTMPTEEAQKEIREIIGARSPVLSVIARLEPRKGIDRVIAALPDLVPRFPSIVFVIAGSGSDRERLEALARDKGVEKHVAFLGPIEDARKTAVLAHTDVFAMPVRRVGNSVEGFGIVYAEAAFFGVPSLGGKGSGAEDAIVDGKTGLLCDGEKQADITAKLLQLLEDEPFRCALAQAAKTRAENEFLWSNALPRFLAALRR